MRTMSLLIGLAFLLSVCAVAQEEIPKVELYAGYSYMRVAPTNQTNAFNSNGGLGQAQLNLNKHVGIVADFGGYANGEISISGPDLRQQQSQFTYLFGPRVFVNKTGKISPFFEFEVGGVHNARSFSVLTANIPATFVVPRGVTIESGQPGFTKFRSTQNAFAMAIGGGIDIKVTHLIAVRPIQLDFMPTHFSPFNFSTSTLFPGFNNSTQWQHNLRYSGGITFRFGGGGA